MGFSTIGSFIIMYFGMIIMITSVFVIYGTLLEGTITLEEQQNREYERMQTSISIDSVSFDKTKAPDMTSLNITNDGTRKLKTSDIDIYIDDNIIPRSELNRTISVISPNSINPYHWDPDEVVSINISMDVENGTHIVVVSVNGIIDSTSFTYP